MSQTLTRRSFVALSASVIFSGPLLKGTSFADTGSVIVKMYSKDPDNKKSRNVFIPRIIKVKPGDTIKFVAEDKGHNSASSKGMLPEGVEKWQGKISKDIEVKFDKPGIYGYECTPHRSLGMVGLVIVEGEGMTDNLEAAQKAKKSGKSKKIWKEIWAEAEEKGLLA